jgi:hypothetical protein
LSAKDNVQIAPAEGKLGILIPGIGAVSTTFIAGVEAIKRGLGLPVGSLTQLATIRLGKRTDGRSPKIKDFVPLAGLDDLVFGGWDIYEDTAYEAAVNAKVPDYNFLFFETRIECRDGRRIWFVRTLSGVERIELQPHYRVLYLGTVERRAGVTIICTNSRPHRGRS